MPIGTIVASAILGATTFSQPRPPKPATSYRIYRWILIPGGGFCVAPTPFFVFNTYAKIDESKLAKISKLRQELHIIIETDSVAKTQELAKAVMDSVKVTVENVQSEEKSSYGMPNTLPCKSDPKSVIDPVVTGF